MRVIRCSPKARGQLGRQLIERFQLDDGRNAQSWHRHQEMWEVDPAQSKPGLVIHTAGWPLDADTYGGSFLYHLDNNLVAVGLIVGLDYANPWLSPFDEFQRYKTHPAIRGTFEGGKRIAYGARAITAGGLLALPKLTVPGGVLVGCEAGFLNALAHQGQPCRHQDRHAGRRRRVRRGAGRPAPGRAVRLPGHVQVLLAARGTEQGAQLQAVVQEGPHRRHRHDRHRTAGAQGQLPGRCATASPTTPACRASQCARIDYPKPDGKLTFDKLSSVFISNTNHDENEPVHLTLKDPAVPVQVNLAKYGGPESRYCPAGVYEFVKDDHGDDRLQINAQNCVHCKTCDIRIPPRTSSGSPRRAAKARLQRHVSMAERARCSSAAATACGARRLRVQGVSPCPAAPAAR